MGGEGGGGGRWRRWWIAIPTEGARFEVLVVLSAGKFLECALLLTLVRLRSLYHSCVYVGAAQCRVALCRCGCGCSAGGVGV